MLALSFSADARAAENSASEAAALLPDSVAIFVQVPMPEQVVDYVMTHPLRESVEEIPEFKQFKSSNEYSAFRGGVALFEAALGMKWRKAVTGVSGAGAYLAVDPSQDAIAILLKGTSEETTQKFGKVLLSTMRLGKEKVQEAEYRGINAFRNDDIAVATLGHWTLATNKPEFGRSILDRYLDRPDEMTLASRKPFANFIQQQTKGAASVFFDIKAIRELGVAPALYSGKSENILAEFLFGGILGSLASSPSASAELNLQPNAVSIAVQIAHADGFPDENRSYFFAPEDEPAAPANLQLDEQVAAMTAYRGLAEAWLRSGDLMIDKATEELAQADSQLSTFFSGKDFGEDILGAFDPRMQIVVQRQAFDGAPEPAIQLPSFALVFKMLQPETTAPEMRRVFISLLGFLNVVGAMEGQPQFDIETERSGDVSLVRASYIPPRDSRVVPINYNFTPTLVTIGDRLIVSSSRDLAKSISDGEPQWESDERCNTLLTVDLTMVHRLLEDNVEQLLAQNMLEKGHSREAAENEIGLLLRLVSLLNEAELRVENAANYLGMDVTIDFDEPTDESTTAR